MQPPSQLIKGVAADSFTLLGSFAREACEARDQFEGKKFEHFTITIVTFLKGEVSVVNLSAADQRLTTGLHFVGDEIETEFCSGNFSTLWFFRRLIFYEFQCWR